MVVRQDVAPHLRSDAFFADPVADLIPRFCGRDRLRTCRLGDGVTALVRSYRHGGFFRGFTRDLFFTWPPRPFRELAVTEEVRRRGIATIDVLGAWIESARGPFYRGWFVTRELAEARDLWAVFQNGPGAGSALHELIRSVARTLRCMHRQGVYHRDLNLRNILVRSEKDGPRAYVIDFDKAKLFSGEVPKAKARRNLSRLLRSISKLDPERRFLSRESWETFLRCYADGRD